MVEKHIFWPWKTASPVPILGTPDSRKASTIPPRTNMFQKYDKGKPGEKILIYEDYFRLEDDRKHELINGEVEGDACANTLASKDLEKAP